MSGEALEDGDWTAVDAAVKARLSWLNMSLPYLSRESGLSQTTIRYLGTPTKNHNKSTLVALSVVLGWRYDHLLNILRGEPEKNVLGPEDSPVESLFANMLRAEVGPVKEEMATLVDIIHVMDEKIDAIKNRGIGRNESE